VYANRRRIRGARGKRLQAGRGERVERNFAHQFDTGGLDRLYVRGLHNVHKKLLIQAAACNLALLMRTLYGAGKPRAAHDRRSELVLAYLWLNSVLTALCKPESVFSRHPGSVRHPSGCRRQERFRTSKTVILGTGC
jgi:transposase